MTPQDPIPRGLLGRAAERLSSAIRGSSRGVEDVAVSLIPQAGKSVAGFLSSVLIARGLGPSGLGQFALVTSVSDSVTILSDLGVGQTALRYASLSASHNDTAGQLAVLRWAFRLRLLITLLMVVVLFLAAPFLSARVWHVDGLTLPLRIGLFIAVFGALAVVPSLYFQSLKRFKMNSFVLTGQTLITLAGVAILAVLGIWSVPGVVTVMALAAAIGAFLFLSRVPREAIFQRRGPNASQRKGLREIWKVPLSEQTKKSVLDNATGSQFAVYLLLSTVIVMITLRLDVWMMGVYLDKSAIGLYNAASRLALPLTLVLGALNTALWPRASSLRSMEEVRSLLSKTFKASALVAAAGIVYALFVPLLAPFIFGEAYRQSVRLAQLLSLGQCVAILFNPVAVIGYSIGMARVYWVVNLIQLCLVFTMLIILLPVYGPVGAAVTFVVSTVVGSLIVGAILLRKTHRRFAGKSAPLG